MKVTVCPIVHGVQALSLDKETARNFGFRVRDYLPEKVRDFVVFPVVDWDSVVGTRQLLALEMEEGLPRQKFLKLKHTLGSDIMWAFPGKTKDGLNWIYQQVFEKVSGEVNGAIRRRGEDCNLMPIGHSWGGQLAFRYCFDSKYRVHGLVTMGTPITAVSGAFKDWGSLPQGMRFWMNFRFKYDWIGSQFHKHKNPAFRQMVHDVHLKSWNPKTWLSLGAHTAYWGSKQVHKTIAELIVKQFYS